MKRLNINTIRSKLILLIMSICISALLLAGVSFSLWNYYSFRQNMIQDFHVQAQMTAENCSAALLFEDVQSAEDILKTYVLIPDIVNCCIYNTENEHFASYIRAGFTGHKPYNVPPDGHLFKDGFLIISEAITLDEEIIGNVLLVSDMEPLKENLATNILTVVAIMVVASLSGFLLTSRLQRIISRPILLLANLAKDVYKRRDYSKRAIKKSNDEIGTLFDAFNMMLDEIQQEIEERTKTQNELIKHRNHLEDLVEERTAELKSINHQLKMSVEKAQLLAKEADRANQTKSQFLANMSHEIRTPMNAIIGFSELLAEENLTEQQLSFLETVLENGKSLLQLINDILDFSKIEAGCLQTEIIECQTKKFLGDIDSFLRPLAAKKSLDFNILPCGNLPSIFYSDPVRLRQCLVNLVSNAIKFTEKGHVYVNVSTEKHNSKDFIRFDVEDTGIGIPEDKQEKIFGSFTQADGSTTRKYGGTGLGLSITKQLTGLMNGTISVKSQPGKGSTFTIMLPAGVDIDEVDNANPYDYMDHLFQAVQSDNAVSSENPKGQKILVAEDAKANQDLIRILLERLGHEVVVVDDGQQAIEAVGNNNFDLIFMDMMMPVLNGYKATKKLRNKGYDLPIIALTANAMKGDDEKCYQVGCDDYITKPIDRKRLNELLNKYLYAQETKSDS